MGGSHPSPAMSLPLSSPSRHQPARCSIYTGHFLWEQYCPGGGLGPGGGKARGLLPCLPRARLQKGGKGQGSGGKPSQAGETGQSGERSERYQAQAASPGALLASDLRVPVPRHHGMSPSRWQHEGRARLSPLLAEGPQAGSCPVKAPRTVRGEGSSKQGPEECR